MFFLGFATGIIFVSLSMYVAYRVIRWVVSNDKFQ